MHEKADIKPMLGFLTELGSLTNANYIELYFERLLP